MAADLGHLAQAQPGHLRGIDGGSVALSMGHSFEVHCRSYPWASTAGDAAAFERANAALMVA
jgi:hypothetical protein